MFASAMTIEGLIKLGILGVKAIQDIRANRAAGKLHITTADTNVAITDAEFDAHFTKWEAAADAASAHASQRIEDRHKNDS